VTKKKKAVLKMKTYNIVADAVDRGVTIGYRRAHKHVENPSEDTLIDAITNAVTGELCEVIDFDK
jgi:hypothetical protein